MVEEATDIRRFEAATTGSGPEGGRSEGDDGEG